MQRHSVLLVGSVALYLAGCGGGGDSPPSSPPPTPPPVTVVSRADATRFLEQATFGPTASDVSHVQTVGFDAYLNEQFAQPKTGYAGFSYVTHTAPVSCHFDAAAPTSAASLCARDNYSLFQVQRKYFQNAVAAPDQLRQRVAFALSQMVVVSGTEIFEAYGMANYQNMLLDDAFGNFRQLLMDVTLSPVMGNYLDMVNNDKPNAARGTQPNENYAREVMQLFSLGLYKLNLDGTRQLDAQSQPIPSYDQDVVEGYAHLFTGWTYPPVGTANSRWTNPINYDGRMVLFADHHDTAAKQILGGVVLPAGQTADQDLNAGIDALFNHPNVGPFIGRQLIQHLVTSNPTPAYVQRVATVFNDDGQGVRGNLQAVVRAILLDAEARGDVQSGSVYGHLREPALFVTSLLRSVGGQSDGVYLRSQSNGMGENIFTPSSVFNFFPPDHLIPNTTHFGPEFGVQDTATTLNRANFVNQVVYGGGAAADATVTSSTGTTLDISSLVPLAGNADQLVQELNQRVAHGALSTEAYQAVVQAVNTLAATDTTNRVRMAVYLLGVSAQFQVER